MLVTFEFRTTDGSVFYAPGAKELEEEKAKQVLKYFAERLFNHKGFTTDTVDENGDLCLVNVDHIVSVKLRKVDKDVET